MIEIQSRQNAALKHLARLGRERKYRRSTGEMLCEGEKMLTEALRSCRSEPLYYRTDVLRGGRAVLPRERGGKSAERYFFLHAAAVGRSGAR